MLTDAQLQQLKTTLEKRQTTLIDYADDHFGQTQEHAHESVSELSNYDNHPADLGTELFERGKDVALNEHAETELEEINEALHAIEQGTYGLCSVCGRDIPFERLEAVPAADKCIDHADNTLYESHRPAEEGVFSPDINPGNVNDVSAQTAYDGEDAWQDVARYGTSASPSDFYDDKADYNDMYINSEERIGGAESAETSLSTDLEGDYAGSTQKYKEDDNGYTQP